MNNYTSKRVKKSFDEIFKIVGEELAKKENNLYLKKMDYEHYTKLSDSTKKNFDEIVSDLINYRTNSKFNNELQNLNYLTPKKINNASELMEFAKECYDKKLEIKNSGSNTGALTNFFMRTERVKQRNKKFINNQKGKRKSKIDAYNKAISTPLGKAKKIWPKALIIAGSGLALYAASSLVFPSLGMFIASQTVRSLVTIAISGTLGGIIVKNGYDISRLTYGLIKDGKKRISDTYKDARSRVNWNLDEDTLRVDEDIEINNAPTNSNIDEEFEEQPEIGVEEKETELPNALGEKINFTPTNPDLEEEQPEIGVEEKETELPSVQEERIIPEPATTTGVTPKVERRLIIPENYNQRNYQLERKNSYQQIEELVRELDTYRNEKINNILKIEKDIQQLEKEENFQNDDYFQNEYRKLQILKSKEKEKLSKIENTLREVEKSYQNNTNSTDYEIRDYRRK